MLQVSIVVGNPNPNSRTRMIAERVIEKLFMGHRIEVAVVELAHHESALFSWPSPKMAVLTERVAKSDLIVFASPTYKASYTGLLKAFLDRYSSQSLAGVPAISIMTGGSMDHSMAPVVNLSPLLHELGANPLRILYFTTEDMAKLDTVTSDFAESIRNALSKYALLAAATSENA